MRSCKSTSYFLVRVCAFVDKKYALCLTESVFYLDPKDLIGSISFGKALTLTHTQPKMKEKERECCLEHKIAKKTLGDCTGANTVERHFPSS